MVTEWWSEPEIWLEWQTQPSVKFRAFEGDWETRTRASPSSNGAWEAAKEKRLFPGPQPWSPGPKVWPVQASGSLLPLPRHQGSGTPSNGKTFTSVLFLPDAQPYFWIGKSGARRTRLFLEDGQTAEAAPRPCHRQPARWGVRPPSWCGCRFHVPPAVTVRLP